MDKNPHAHPIRSLIENQRGIVLQALAGPETLFITPIGNFAYRSAEYGGDDVLTPFPGGCQAWLESIGHDQCRDKGIRSLASRLTPDWIWEPAKVVED